MNKLDLIKVKIKSKSSCRMNDFTRPLSTSIYLYRKGAPKLNFIKIFRQFVTKIGDSDMTYNIELEIYFYVSKVV